jgi:hypothetical protein
VNYHGTGWNRLFDSQDEIRASPPASSVSVPSSQLFPTGHSTYRGGPEARFPCPWRIVGIPKVIRAVLAHPLDRSQMTGNSDVTRLGKGCRPPGTQSNVLLSKIGYGTPLQGPPS